MKEMLLKIFNQILKSGKIPCDWKKMIVISIHKKNDKLFVPANYQAISPLSIPDKMFNTIILKRIAGQIDLKLSENIIGFLPGRGRPDATFVLCKILEKSISITSKFTCTL